MRISRRRFLGTAAAAAGTVASGAVGQRAHAEPLPAPAILKRRPSDPWLEIDAAALAHNVRTVARLTGGRPILAVAKNNAYGFGCATVGPLLDRLSEVRGIAVVRVDEAVALREAGVRKPVLLMARCEPNELDELLAHDVSLTPDEGLQPHIVRRAQRLGAGRAAVHLYVDTGMHRMGVPLARAGQLAETLGAARGVRIAGMFTELTEDVDFDRAQVGQLRDLAASLRQRGIDVGPLHAASSHAVWHVADAHLDLIRPGIALYGGYPSAESRERGELRAAYSLRAPVVRVQRLDAGEGVSYHRRWKAAQPTWIATLPIGHVDGYPSGAVKGCEVLIAGRLYPVIGTVSASHTVIALGADTDVKAGDVATLVGPQDPAIHPNEIAKRAAWSEYNMFMHLNPLLAREVVGA
ncbi:MAG: alanine racemase [Gemmatimonadaceae bacterium]